MNLDDLSEEEFNRLKSLINEKGIRGEKENSKKIVKASVETKENKSGVNRFFYIGGGIILSVLLAFAYVLFIDPMIVGYQAQQELNREGDVASIHVGNGEMISYDPEEKYVLNGANPKQLALGVNKTITSPAYFEFKSKNTDDKSHIVDLYLDFYSQSGRDFISFNQTTLTNLIGNGRIILRVHPAVQKNGFSIYAPEALAEVFGTNPDKAWSFFVKLMKESDSVLSSNSPEDKAVSDQEILKFIGDISADVGVPAGACTSSPCNTVDSDSIQFLTFFSWLYSATDQPPLSSGNVLPMIYIDNKLVNQETYRLADPASVISMFNNLAARR